jgi:superoxide dismutase, Fe-Mn family
MHITPNSQNQFELPELPYDYNALEKAIDSTTMEIHYSKHHKAYIDKLNTALVGQDDLLGKSLNDLLGELTNIPKDIQGAIQNHGGGHYNHSLFWNIMKQNGGGEPSGELANAIKNDFGGFEELKELFSDSATKQFGSGWAWIVMNNGKLEVYSTPNQDCPISKGHTPILGLDVWEHAYYLKYQNKRPNYIESWWNIVNWEKVNELFIAS